MQRGSDLLHPARRLVLQSAHQQPPPRPQDPPVQPGLLPDVPARALPACLSRTGSCYAICRPSTRITSKRRARSVLVFSAQSVRRSVSRARSRAIACLTRPRRFDPRVARASLRCSRRSLIRSRAVRAGQCSNSPGRQGRGDHHPPVDPHDLAGARCRDRIGNGREGDMPAPGAVHRDPVGLHLRRHGAGPAEPHPPGLGHPDLADLTGHPAHVPLPAASPGDPESLIPPGLAPRRPPASSITAC